jgi:hypothetical protein
LTRVLGEIDRTEGHHWNQASMRSATVLPAAPPVLAGADLADEAGFELASLGLGRGGTGLLALAAGERVAVGVDDDPPAVARFLITRRLLDHPGARMIRR